MVTPNNGALIYDDHFINPSEPTGLWWCKDAEDVQAIGVNAVCKGITSSWQEVSAWENWVNQFPYIFVCIPAGEERDEIVAELGDRFDLSVNVPSAESFRGYGSVKEYMEALGIRALDKLLISADEVPRAGLLNVADIDCKKKLNQKRVVSGIGGLDSMIGGFVPGALTVWTGKRGEGKSTLLGQVMLEAVNQNHTVCAYSGELPKQDFKLGLLQQAAGYLNVKAYDDPRTSRRMYQVVEDVIPYINEWWNYKLFLTDIDRKNSHDEETILRNFEYANRRYGADTFVVDNIMTAELKDEAKLGYWRAQSSFTGHLVAFAKRLGVHVHLVAHPRKTQGAVVADDVGGSSDITNRADNVLMVERVDEEKVPELGYSASITVLKNREFGARGVVKLDYNDASRRLYPAGGSPGKAYSWEEAMRRGR